MAAFVRRPLPALLVVAGLGLVACDGGEPEVVADGYDPGNVCAEVTANVDRWLDSARSRAPESDDPRMGGTLVAAGIGEFTNGGMNPFVGGDYVGRMHQQFVGLMTLLRYDDDLLPEPYLAESWEMAPDGSSVTFHIRRDVTWHDGEPTDAHDVAFTYRNITDPRSGFGNDGFWTHWVPGAEGVEVLDDYTVRMRLRPHSDPLAPWHVVAIMPEHLLGDVPVEELGGHPVGTQCPLGNGPFVFREHRVGDRWSFEANPAFPEDLGGRPMVDRYVYRVIPEQSTILNELLTGGVDFFVQPRPDLVERIQASPDTRFVHFPSRSITFVAWNGRLPKLSDARVRRALTTGWNRRQFVETTFRGYGRVQNATLHPAHFAYTDAMADALPYDPDAARALLEEAGWVDRDGDGIRENEAGQPLSIELAYNSANEVWRTAAEYMQAQLREVGVDIRLRGGEFGSFIGAALDPERRAFEGMFLGLTAEFRLDDTDLFRSDRHAAQLALSATDNPRLDALIDSLTTTTDRRRATRLWRDYTDVLIEEQPFTFLYNSDRLIGLSNRVQGAEMDLRGEWRTLPSWWIDPGAR